MKSHKTEPITIRIPTETKQILREMCMEKNIDLAEHIRRLIDRDIAARDSIPAPEKKYIERALEAHELRLVSAFTTYFNRNFGDKIDKIFFNMGSNYDKATVKSKQLCAYLTAKYAEIKRPCPDDLDTILVQYRNKYGKVDSNLWEKADKTFKAEIDNEVKRSEFLYRMMDYAVERCKKKEIANIFETVTIQDFRRMLAGFSGEKEVNFSEIEPRMTAEINAKIEEHDLKAFTACARLKRYAGIEHSDIEAENAAAKAWLQQLKQSKNIEETERKIHAAIKPKSIFNKAKELYVRGVKGI